MRVLTLTLLATLAFAAPAAAQRVVVPGPEPGASPDLGRARDQFAAGTSAADEGRWVDALGSFRESYALSGIAAALYNAATTYRSLGRYLDARDTFDQLLRDHPSLGGEMAADAQRLREEVAARVAALQVDGLPEPSEALRLRLDGSLFPDSGSRPLTVEVDPGRRAFGVELERYEPFLWEGSLGDGQRSLISVELIELPKDGPRVGRVIGFLILGAAIIAGGVVAAVFLRDTGLAPETDRVIMLGDR